MSANNQCLKPIRMPDLNRAQHLFLRQCIVRPNTRTNLCAVGDPSQAIYAFRWW